MNVARLRDPIDLISFWMSRAIRVQHLRGFDARPTVSMHYIADPRFTRAVRDYLAKERTAVANEIEWLDEQSPLKRE